MQRLFTPDTKFDADGLYSFDLVVDEENLAKYKDAGIQSKPKVTDNGVTVKLKRKAKGMFENTGGAPKVMNKDGSTWDREFGGIPGNGSKVSARVVVFDTKKGKGFRLEAVRVDELVEYKPEPKEPEVAAETPQTSNRKTQDVVPF
jgi:hypothetical protein